MLLAASCPIPRLRKELLLGALPAGCELCMARRDSHARCTPAEVLRLAARGCRPLALYHELRAAEKGGGRKALGLQTGRCANSTC